MNNFLPDNYERPATSGGNYAKLEDGANRFRFLSPAIVGWLYWTKDNKPVRLREKPTERPEDMREDDKIKHMWAFAVWNYKEGKIQILELTQASIQGPIEDLVMTEDWGDPTGYDITITKKGQKLDTEYSVQPSPHKPVAEDVAALFKATHVDLPALFDSKDPFAPSEPKDNIASSKPAGF